MESNSNNSTAAFINLSTLSQYFIPFGNFIFPIIIWGANKAKSTYIDEQGKQTINFQLSLFLYTLILVMIAIPIVVISFFNNISFDTFISNEEVLVENFDFSNMTAALTIALCAIALLIALKIAEFFLIIYASLKTSNGDNFKYPFTIKFIK